MPKIAALTVCLLPIAAHAIVPATAEQMLCRSGQVVIADVISGVSADCRLKSSDCPSQDFGRLNIRIVQVLATGDDASFRRFGVKPDANKVLGKPHEVRTRPVVEAQTVEVTIITLAPAYVPLTDAVVDERFRGKRLLLSLYFGGDVIPLKKDESNRRFHDDPPVFVPPGTDLHAQQWKPEQREWVEKTLATRAGKQCPRLIANTTRE